MFTLDLDEVNCRPGKKWITYPKDTDNGKGLQRDYNVYREWYNVVWIGGVIYVICLYVLFINLHLLNYYFYHFIIWTIDQCWNMFTPTYFGNSVENILKAVNNTATTEDTLKHKGIRYYVMMQPATANPPTGSGTTYSVPEDATEINAEADLSKRWDAVAKRMTEDVEKEQRECWTTGKYKDYVRRPLYISFAISGVSLLSMLMVLSYPLDQSMKLFLTVSMFLSIITVVFLICCVIEGNYIKIVSPKDVNIQKDHLEYTGHTNWYKIKATKPIAGNITITIGDANPVDVSDVENASANNPYYFELRNMSDLKVQVKSDHTADKAKTDKLAEDNIIATVELFA